MQLLDIKNLSISYSIRSGSVRAVQNVSFSIAPGECVGIVGESGCGKSTIGMSIMRLLSNNGHIVGGSIKMGGKDLATASEQEMLSVRGNEIALIPQDPMTSLHPVKKIGEQIGEGFRIHRGASKEEARARALEVLRLVEMPNPEQRLDQYPHELSGGLRQRVMIAMALVCEPKVLIADEPTTALDVTIQAQILDLLDRLRSELQMAVILITHDMGVIAGRTDRVVVMYAGQKVEVGLTEDIFENMRHPYTGALLSSVPRLDAAPGTQLQAIAGMPPDLSTEIVGCHFAPRCKLATEQCRTEQPALTKSTDNHLFACFHPINGPQETKVVIRDSSNDSDVKPSSLLEVRNAVMNFPLRSRGVFNRQHEFVSAVSNVSFDVAQGETFGLVGESGCGKTTLGRLIVGLEEANSGTITFSGVDKTLKGKEVPKELARVRQMMFQDPYASLDPRKRVLEIIAEPLEIQNLGTRSSRYQQVAELLNEVGLSPEVAERYPHEFSGGQRQRIGLARALAVRPKLVITDEPVSALDVSVQAQILNLMQDLSKQHNLSYILISHDLAVVRYISDRIGVMYLGKLVEVGPANDVLANPAHHYTQGLIDAVPIANVKIARERKRIQVRGELPSSINPPSGCRFRTRCPMASDICTNEEPPYTQVSPGHVVACHFPLRTTTAIATV